jgi:hypothetical protein
MGTTVKARGKVPLKVGERVGVIARGSEIVIRPIVEIPRNQAWFWRKEWQEQVSQSIKDLERGKMKVFRSVKEVNPLKLGQLPFSKA